MNRLLVLISFLCSFQLFASHIVGGDIYYDYLGNNQYRFYVSIYRDCFSSGAAYDNPLHLGVFLTNNSQRIQDVDIPFPGSNVLPIVFNNPCITAPTNICTERAIYTTTLTLPPTFGGYTIAYQRCCRGPNINNLVQPENTGLTLTIKIPGSETGAWANSSGRFTNYPPLVLCNNDDLVFDHSATDPDGDVIVYSLFTPNAGASDLNPYPNPIPPPSYPLVQWSAGHSATVPLGPGSTININQNTGLLTADPNLQGRYVVGIRMDEYRNGMLINSTIRDFIFTVINCNISLQANLPTQPQLPGFVSYCQGLFVQFANNSFGGTTYEWDFGVPGITTDVSTAFTPSYTYPDQGDYVAMLVVNPGWPCTDTAYIDISVYNEINPTFTSTDSICLVDNAYDFFGTSDGLPGTTYSWDFGNATPAQDTGATVLGVSFATSGYHEVTLAADFMQCHETYSDSIFVIPEPIADFEMPFNYECDGLTVNFINNTQFANTYQWDFGINNQTSTDFQPSHTFPSGGTYVVELITSSNPLCADTLQQILTVNEKMNVSIDAIDNQCITDNSFDFIGNVTGPNHAVFTWNFGPTASLSTSNDTSVYNVSFSQNGAVQVSLTGTFDDCIETDTVEFYLYQQPAIDFTMIEAQQCAPFTAEFIDYSFSETPLNYLWDFGDGTNSSVPSPSHVYEDPGMYIVSLTVWTTDGCIDTLFLSQSDLVDVYPTPIAQFSVDKDITDICDATIQFTDESIDATKWYYQFDDSTTFSHNQHPFHGYITSGTHYPTLIASNEEGCADTTFTRIIIEPFTVFAPNAFTPDGDEFNNVFTPKVWLHPTEWELKIYNRWGEVIFETTDYELGWDGTYKGQPMQNGIYNYSINYKPCTVEFTEVVFHGYVNLLR